MTTERTLHIQNEAAKNLVAELAGMDIDDDETIAEALESETNLLEAIESALEEMDYTDALIRGLDEKIKEFSGRKTSMKNRVDRIRALIEQAMSISELEKLVLSTATLSLRKNKPGLVITDETAIPSQFWIEQPRPAPKLDKAALKDALASETVDGAELDNGSVSLTVRRK